MELVGTPPVPPRKAFGLWVSEFGYRNWATIDRLAAGLRRDGFPVDGFVLDLFWFGGYQDSSPDSAMGRLAWDTSAGAAWLDVPVRPHTNNVFGTANAPHYATAPDLVGDLAANRENLRQRYTLLPYYYSLAHRAFRFGEPVVPPLVYQYQGDPTVRAIGHEKLIGKDLLVAIVAGHGEYVRDVYLPGGSSTEWVDLHTREWFPGGGWKYQYPVYLQGRFTLPAFACGGAIIPEMYVDDQTLDAFGARKDGTTRDELVVQAFAGKALVGAGARSAKNGFTLFEDDGATASYDAAGRPVYQTRTTELSLATRQGSAAVTVAAAQGSYPGAPASRNVVVRLVVEDAQATRVTLDGAELPERKSQQELDAAPSGWWNAGRNLVEAKTGVLPIGAARTVAFTLASRTPAASLNFACGNAWTKPGETLRVVGDIPALGSWKPEGGLELGASIAYPYVYAADHCGPGPFVPTWTGVASELPPDTTIHWKCVKHALDGTWVWQPDPNNAAKTLGRGFSGTARGAM